MDFLPETLNLWLLNYGSFALFGLLALGILALPVPEETLLVFTGALLRQGSLDPFSTICAAYFGSIVGITGSYLIGHTGGIYLVKKYGPYIGFSDAKMAKIHDWSEHYGKWLLFIGYFIPGIRHFTGVFAGVSDMEYRHFALYAYSGAAFWVATFLSIGYVFGHFPRRIYELIESNIEIVMGTGLVLGLLIMCTWAVLSRRKKTSK